MPPKKESLCAYCGLDVGHRPYARKRDMPSVSAVAELIDEGKSNAFGWSAALLTATLAVHDPDRWRFRDTRGCEHVKEALCDACAYLRREHKAVWDAKAALGSHVHHLALAWAERKEVDADEASVPFLDAMEQFYVDCEPEWTLLESTVLFDKYPNLSYRGQFDEIGNLLCPVCPGERCAWLLDTKTGRYSPGSQTLQLAGYRYATWVTDWSSGKEVKVGPVPEVKHAGVLLLNAEGYRVVELPVTHEVHSLFLRLREHWNWQRDMKAWERANPLRPAIALGGRLIETGGYEDSEEEFVPEGAV